MAETFTVTIDAWTNGGPIPGEYAFCVPAEQGHVTMGANRNPPIRWSGAPSGTRSFAILCVDPDVPSKVDDVNKEGRTIPADLARVDFYHWVLVDIPTTVTEIPAGADADGVTAGGKPLGKTPYGIRGYNTYTDFLGDNETMAGDYGGYDGPCPPWNDAIVHHYHFTVYALDVESLGLAGRFGGSEALAAMQGHILAQQTWTGTYTLNRALMG